MNRAKSFAVVGVSDSGERSVEPDVIMGRILLPDLSGFEKVRQVWLRCAGGVRSAILARLQRYA